MTVPAVVLLHGQPDTSASFWALRAELRRRLGARVHSLGAQVHGLGAEISSADTPGAEIKVFAPDRPGYGANQNPVTDYPGNVAWLRSWLQQHELGPVVLVAHSWAGGIALLAAAEGDPAIAGVVLVSSVGPDCLLLIDRVLALPLLGEVASFAGLRLARPVLMRQARRIIRPRTPVADQPFAIASALGMFQRPLWRSFLDEQRALIRQLPLITAAISNVVQPALVIRGRADTLIPVATPQALQRLLPRSEEITLDGGHDLQLRQPMALAAAVAPFVRSVLGVPVRRD